ncbi:MAG TPA: aldolase/citrate lyase family protein [Vicinamibacterales bacterium]|nr:aldolase/citrate lyase family protein [Vicinamibacterales bacterium]
MPPSFRARLRSGELLFAPLMTLSSPAVAELMAETGFDWLFIDAEHSTLDTSQMQLLLQAAGATPCVIRLVSGDEEPIKKALDIGAAGIIVPQVNSAEQARRIVQAAKYAPVGQRGLGIARAHRYGLKVREYMQSANDDTAVIVQAEHRDAVANIQSIVRVEGVDGVLIGPYDLSASFGRPGAVDHPEVREAIARVRAACLEAQIPIGIFGLTADAVKPYMAQGFTMIVAGVDTVLLANAATTLVAALRGT